ncbi:MAG: Asp23/Gls24 family envelope stress response protein [Lentisphaerota bacterium]
MKRTENIIAPQEEAPISYKTIESITDYGTVKISERVIMSVVKKAASKVDGVTRLASGSFVDCLTNMISNAKSHDKAVKLDINGDTVKIELKLSVAYGKNIQELALKVQNTVTDEVKAITGMKVTKIDVVIQEVDAKEEESK